MDKFSFIFGFLLAFLPLFFIELIRNFFKKREQKFFAINLILSLTKEIEEGINRCHVLIKQKEDNKFSFSRIYITYWNNAKFTICSTITDIELLGLLHEIYYHFDLVNFNMERNNYGAGAAFAEHNIVNILNNYKLLEEKIALLKSQKDFIQIANDKLKNVF